MGQSQEWYEICYFPMGEIDLQNNCDYYTEQGQYVRFESLEEAQKALRLTPMARRDLNKAFRKFAIFKSTSEIVFTTAKGFWRRFFGNPRTHSEWYELLYFPEEWDFDKPYEPVLIRGLPMAWRHFSQAFDYRKNLLERHNIPDEERGRYQIVRRRIEIVDPVIHEYGIRRYGI